MVDAYKLINKQLSIHNQNLRLKLAEQDEEIIKLNRGIQQERCEKIEISDELQRISEILETLKTVITNSQTQIARVLNRTNLSSILEDPHCSNRSQTDNRFDNSASSSYLQKSTTDNDKLMLKVPPLVKNSSGQVYHSQVSIRLERLDPSVLNDVQGDDVDSIPNMNLLSELSDHSMQLTHDEISTATNDQPDHISDHSDYDPSDPADILSTSMNMEGRPLPVIPEADENTRSQSRRDSTNKENDVRTFLDSTPRINWTLESLPQSSTSTPIAQSPQLLQGVKVVLRPLDIQNHLNKTETKDEHKTPELKEIKKEKIKREKKSKSSKSPIEGEVTELAEVSTRPQRKRSVKSLAEPKLNNKLRRNK